MTGVPTAPAAGATADVGTNEANVKRSLRSGIVRAVLTAPLSLLTGPFIVHHVGLISFGTWSTLVTVLFLGTLVDAGVSTEIVRRVADAQGRGDRVLMQRTVSEGVSMLASAGLVVTVTGILCTPLLVPAILPGLDRHDQHQAELLLGLIFVLLLVQLVTTAYFAVLGGLQRADIANRAGVISNVVSTAVTCGLAASGAGLWAMVIGFALGLLCLVFVQYRGLRRLLPQWKAPLIRVRRGVAVAFLTTSLFLSVGALSDLVDTQLDKILLARYAGVATTAQYQIGASLALQVRAVAFMPLFLLLPGVAERRVSGTHRELHERVTTPITATAAAAMMGVVCIGHPFAVLLYGSSYGHVGEAVRAFGACGLFAVLAAPWTFYAIGTGQARLTAFAAGVSVVVNATVSSTLIITLGFSGSLIGSFVATVAGATALGLALKRADPDFTAINGRLMAALISMAGVAGLSWWLVNDRHLSPTQFILAALASACALTICLTVTRAVRLQDIRLLLSRGQVNAPAAT